jgi:MFS family permease
MGAIGNLVALLTIGHLVHKYGARWILHIASFSLGISLIFLTHSTSSLVFLVFIIIQGGAISAFHISINAQGFFFQDRTKRQIITLMSGFWSSGALISSLIAGLLVDRIALGTYSNFLALFCFALMTYIIHKITPNLVKADTSPDTEHRARDMFKGFKIDKPGICCVVISHHARIRRRRLGCNLCERRYEDRWWNSYSAIHSVYASHDHWSLKSS